MSASSQSKMVQAVPCFRSSTFDLILRAFTCSAKLAYSRAAHFWVVRNKAKCRKAVVLSPSTGACLLLFAIFFKQASKAELGGCATVISQSGLGLQIKNLFVYLLMVPGCATVAAAFGSLPMTTQAIPSVVHR